jgi:hypothetical protein
MICRLVFQHCIMLAISYDIVEVSFVILKMGTHVFNFFIYHSSIFLKGKTPSY